MKANPKRLRFGVSTVTPQSHRKPVATPKAKLRFSRVVYIEIMDYIDGPWLLCFRSMPTMRPNHFRVEVNACYSGSTLK